jgi:RNA polymerase sigma-70 factor, ECF subfamily
MDLETDELLAKRFAETGDGRAMELLFRRHLDKVYRLAQRYFAIREDAEEIVSETFLRSFKALRDGQFRGDAAFATWLTRITINLCFERLRQPRLPTLQFDDIPSLAEAEPSGAANELREAMARMPEDQRLAVTLCDLEGYPAKEVALVFGKSVTAVKSLHYRGRRTLRDLLFLQREEADGV